MNLLDILKDVLRKPVKLRRQRNALNSTIDALESRLLLTAPTLTDSEQYLLELVNRARANPAAEAARYGIGLNDGLSAGTISTAAKQPLAPQQQLMTAAGLHSQDMLDRDYFSHVTQGAGTTFDERITNQGYGWTLVAENIGFVANTASISQTAFINAVHEGLIKSAGHRENIMTPELEEVGIGAKLGTFHPAGDPTTYPFTEMVTEDFGERNLDPYLTGVVYTDSDNNHFYTIGESIRNGSVTAVNVTTGASFSDTIGISGAYGLILPSGTYTVTATFTMDGVDQIFQQPGNVVVGTSNIKVDFETNSGVLVPAALDLSSTVTALNEFGATTIAVITVTRNGSLADSLTVNLTSSDTSEVTVPVSVIIPAGQSSATFTAAAVNDGVIDGIQLASITAAAAGFPVSISVLSVADRTYPALPTGSQTAATARPTFTWTNISNAASYEVYVNNVTTHESRVVDVTGITTNTYTTATDLPIGTYNVWVRGFTAAGVASVWSPATVWQLRPTTTVLNSGRTEPSGNFSIVWTAIPGASAYDVWVNRLTSATSQYLRNTSVSGTSLTVSGFDVGAYAVWVQARNTAGDFVNWSPRAIINVSYAPRSINVAAADLSSDPTLTWTAVGGAAQYDVWINNLTTGVSAVIRNSTVQGTQLGLPGLPAASYRAWVRARDLAGGGSCVWSSAFDFEVGRAPRVTAPSGGGQLVRPTFTWTPVSGATRYEIWLSNLTTVVRVFNDSGLNSTSYTSPTALTSANTYRVWIRAFDSTGTASTWSQPVTFTVARRSENLPDSRPGILSVKAPLLELLFESVETWLHEHDEQLWVASAGPTNADFAPDSPIEQAQEYVASEFDVEPRAAVVVTIS